MVRITRELVLDLSGTLQGVGLRPTLQRLAEEAGLGGYAQNRSGTVRLALRGSSRRIEAFVRDLPERLPRSARIDGLQVVSDHRLTCGAAECFAILSSETRDEPRVSIPPDLALCPRCARAHTPLMSATQSVHPVGVDGNAVGGRNRPVFPSLGGFQSVEAFLRHAMTTSQGDYAE